MNSSHVAVSDKTAVSSAADRFGALAANVAGLRAFTVINIEQAEPMTGSDGSFLAATSYGWPSQFEKYWREPTFGFGSPIRAACRVDNRPFWVNSRGIHGVTNNPYANEIDFGDLEEKWHVKAAIVVPVYLPFSQIAFSVFTCEQNLRSDLGGEFNEYGEILNRISYKFLSDCFSLQPRPANLVAEARLTKRERECLRWISQGKTDDETAIIMSISRSTVRFHIQNALLKLNVTNRTQAVTRAAQLGFLPGVARHS